MSADANQIDSDVCLDVGIVPSTLDFFLTQTKIPDALELRKHILELQSEAVKVLLLFILLCAPQIHDVPDSRLPLHSHLRLCQVCRHKAEWYEYIAHWGRCMSTDEDKHLAVISRVLGGLEIARKSSLPGRRRLLCVPFLSYISFYAHINTIRQSGLTFGRLPQTDFPCTI